MEGRSYFWKMAAVCVLVSAVLLTGCGGTGSPAADDPGFDERIFGTWEREFEWGDYGTHRSVWEFRRDWMLVTGSYGELITGGSTLPFSVNADILRAGSALGGFIFYERFSLPDANTLVTVTFRMILYLDDTRYIIEESAPALTWRRVTQ